MDANLVSVLDLYAGTGALGIEALSRGALHCDFVERDAAACAAIKENLRLTGFEGRARVLCRPVERARELLDGPYTLIIADPPYDDDAALALLDSLAATALLADNAVLVLEQAARREAREALGKLSLASVRRHGDTAVAIYRRGR
jgi:16S rRNA (guanine966-N2)-methyltransferase